MNGNELRELRQLVAEVIDDLAYQDLRVARVTASVAALRQALKEYDPDFEPLYLKHYLGPEVSELRHQHDDRILALVEAAKKLRNIEN